MVPEGKSTARTFSSAGWLWPQARTRCSGTRPLFDSRSHNVASELRKRAAQNASKTFSKVETPRGQPHPAHLPLRRLRFRS